jgi:hypothetical protein
MKNTLFIFLALMLLASCKSKDSTTRYDYASTIVEDGVQGTVVIKAWGEGKNMEVAKTDAKRNAVYSLLFKGFPSANGVLSNSLRPMVTNPNAEQQYKSYFDAFFAEGGKYLQFVRFADDIGRVAVGDVVKSSEKYKVGVVVVVDQSSLRREMEQAGIINKFGINY